ncbi:MAG: hypothetical protein JSR45_10585 [Proteobacteria bacterium]|nr:hypothetical protein [Pseudomonadota bacterium]
MKTEPIAVQPSPWSPQPESKRPRHLRALIAWDALRLRGWVRNVSSDRLGFVLVMALFAAMTAGAAVGAFRLGLILSARPAEALLAGAGAAVVAGMLQAGLGRALALGPLEAVVTARASLHGWVFARLTIFALPFLAPLVTSAAKISALPPLAVLVGFLIAAVGFACLPEPAANGPALGAQREHKSRIAPRFGLWAVALLPLRSRRFGLPGWLAPVAIAVASGVAARLAVQHGAAKAALGLIGGGAILAGAETRALDADLLALLGRSPQRLRRLVALFSLPPALVALLAGAVAATVSGAPLAWAAAGLGAVGVGLWAAVDVLNLLAFGPNAQVRTLIYAALAGLLAQAIGPVALLIGLLGLGWLWRLALSRRWGER